MLRDVQHQLAEWQADPPTDVWSRSRRISAGNTLDYRRGNALFALTRPGNGARTNTLGLADAKREEIGIADGHPLTICLGPRERTIEIATEHGKKLFPVSGCGQVFPDSTVTSGGHMWPRLCPGCAARKSKRDQQRRLQAMVDARRGIRKKGRPFREPFEH